MDNRHIRATSNLAKLEIVARKLEELNDEVVYVGGCTTALFINDPLTLDVRPTQDVDCIVDIVSLREYNKFGKALSKKGFRQSIQETVICRWFHEDRPRQACDFDTLGAVRSHCFKSKNINSDFFIEMYKDFYLRIS